MPNQPLVSKLSFGHLSNGQEATLYRLTNRHGTRADLSDYGATLVSFLSADNEGQLGDIVLGFDDVRAYEASDAYIGATVGRFANRIAKAQFELNGKQYTLDANNGPNHLHGGLDGFNSRIWQAKICDTEAACVEFSLRSPDGDQGYPGNMDISVRYLLDDNNKLHISISASSDADTPISITNHSYFNLSGGGDIGEHLLQINSSEFTPLDENQIPTGEIAPVANTPFDFRELRKVGEHIGDAHPQLRIGAGYDHNFMLQQEGNEALAAAKLVDENSGRVLTLSTNAPGLQLYTANFLDGSQGKGITHQPRHALCLEPQNIPNAPNDDRFPSGILRAGETYTHTMILEVSVTR